MGLITETNAQYYAGQQKFLSSSYSNNKFPCTFDTDLTLTVPGVSNANFKVYVNNGLIYPNTDYTLEAPNTVFVNNFSLSPNDIVKVQLDKVAIDQNRGEYAYVKLNDVIDNFMTAYVGDGKYITNVKRKDVIFHAKRGLQEFSYDTLRSLKSQEVEIPNSLSVAIPQDYVNYTRLSWVDADGVQRTIYPTNTITMDPIDPLLQDADGNYIQDDLNDNTKASQAIIQERWREFNENDLTGKYMWENSMDSNIYNWSWWKTAYGQRYGLQPEVSQGNGWFSIDDRTGAFTFSSDLCKKIIVIEYISDGLAYDVDTKIPKMIEQAMYMHIAHAILSTKIGIPEYIIQRFKKDRRAQLRNAKIRLQNLKLDTLIQTMRGKSKWIKH